MSHPIDFFDKMFDKLKSRGSLSFNDLGLIRSPSSVASIYDEFSKVGVSSSDFAEAAAEVLEIDTFSSVEFDVTEAIMAKGGVIYGDTLFVKNPFLYITNKNDLSEIPKFLLFKNIGVIPDDLLSVVQSMKREVEKVRANITSASLSANIKHIIDSALLVGASEILFSKEGDILVPSFRINNYPYPQNYHLSLDRNHRDIVVELFEGDQANKIFTKANYIFSGNEYMLDFSYVVYPNNLSAISSVKISRHKVVNFSDLNFTAPKTDMKKFLNCFSSKSGLITLCGLRSSGLSTVFKGLLFDYVSKNREKSILVISDKIGSELSHGSIVNSSLEQSILKSMVDSHDTVFIEDVSDDKQVKFIEYCMLKGKLVVATGAFSSSVLFLERLYSVFENSGILLNGYLASMSTVLMPILCDECSVDVKFSNYGVASQLNYNIENSPAMSDMVKEMNPNGCASCSGVSRGIKGVQGYADIIVSSKDLTIGIKEFNCEPKEVVQILKNESWISVHEQVMRDLKSGDTSVRFFELFMPNVLEA